MTTTGEAVSGESAGKVRDEMRAAASAAIWNGYLYDVDAIEFATALPGKGRRVASIHDADLLATLAVDAVLAALCASPASPDYERAIDEAAEQVIIAFGRGWDLDGVIVNLANALGVAIPDAPSPPSAPESEVAS